MATEIAGRVLKKSSVLQAEQKCPDAKRPQLRGIRRTGRYVVDAGEGQRSRWAFFISLPGLVEKITFPRLSKNVQMRGARSSAA
ncbi:hypothetical protein B5V00_02270 [Geothermobacter hydrogeniphilus]|uniref:Uncharacterized protein n=1 Tax=Geothermobacter hydrogeniphilus TaxID=1969733 RepID=A0A1X0YD52_9BACT|nr:hypothetical protein B5V00_02270 [Geothermobacter hydrogeniphilus]